MAEIISLAEHRRRKAEVQAQTEFDPGQAETLRILDRIEAKLGLTPLPWFRPSAPGVPQR
jgi:hypothetical protein